MEEMMKPWQVIWNILYYENGNIIISGDEGASEKYNISNLVWSLLLLLLKNYVMPEEGSMK